MIEIWSKIEILLRIKNPHLLETLQPGVPDIQISEIEEFLSVKFPDDIKSLYRILNGQSDCNIGLINGYEFLSLDRIKEEWSIWKNLLDSGTFQDENGNDIGSEADPGIRNVWWCPKWIPLTSDGSGNHNCLDLNPAEGGIYGQIITMLHDDVERKIVAPGIKMWLQQYAQRLESM